MKITFTLNDQSFDITPYNTAQEKDILLLLSFDQIDIDKVFDILNFKYECNLTEDEKKVILYKYREISLGDEVDIKFKCDKCGQGNDGVLQTSDLYKEGERNDKDVKKLKITVTDETLHEFVDFDVDELEIDAFEGLKERVLMNQTSINFIKEVKCFSCGALKQIDIGDTKYIIEILSDDNLMSLYKTYNFLTFFSHYTKQDIDSMLPFERSIFVGLLNKTKEDLAK